MLIIVKAHKQEKITNSKHQITNNLQIPITQTDPAFDGFKTPRNTNQQTLAWDVWDIEKFVIGAYLFFGICNLVLFIWYFSFL
jgi:hypothetical protein